MSLEKPASPLRLCDLIHELCTAAGEERLDGCPLLSGTPEMMRSPPAQRHQAVGIASERERIQVGGHDIPPAVKLVHRQTPELQLGFYIVQPRILERGFHGNGIIVHSEDCRRAQFSCPQWQESPSRTPRPTMKVRKRSPGSAPRPFQAVSGIPAWFRGCLFRRLQQARSR